MALRPSHDVVHAVCGVDLDLFPGETLALVGESGSGKSTVGRLLMGIISPTSGEVLFEGTSTRGIRGMRMRRFRRAAQLVFQDPTASRNPRMQAGDLIAEPLRVGGVARTARVARAEELIVAVGLRSAHLRRYPHEFSGGQRQRISIARVLSTSPRVLVLDEPVSALDVSAQAGVINLLKDLEDALSLSYLLISHDIALVRHIATRIAVMYMGRIVEIGDQRQIIEGPAHPYTHTLISAVPEPDPGVERSLAAPPRRRGHAESGEPPVGMPVPHPVPEIRWRAERTRQAALRDRLPRPGRSRNRPSGRLSLPAEAPAAVTAVIRACAGLRLTVAASLPPTATAIVDRGTS